MTSATRTGLALTGRGAVSLLAALFLTGAAAWAGTPEKSVALACQGEKGEATQACDAALSYVQHPYTIAEKASDPIQADDAFECGPDDPPPICEVLADVDDGTSARTCSPRVQSRVASVDGGVFLNVCQYCCEWVIVLSPNGWPRVVQSCAFDTDHCEVTLVHPDVITR